MLLGYIYFVQYVKTQHYKNVYIEKQQINNWYKRITHKTMLILSYNHIKEHKTVVVWNRMNVSTVHINILQKSVS